MLKANNLSKMLAQQGGGCCGDHQADSSSVETSSEPVQSSLSRPAPWMNKEAIQPQMARPPKRLHAKASPLGWMLVDNVNRAPDTKGPMLRPRAERVCARPFRLPRLACDGAELVIYLRVSQLYHHSTSKATHQEHDARQAAHSTEVLENQHRSKLQVKPQLSGTEAE